MLGFDLGRRVAAASVILGLAGMAVSGCSANDASGADTAFGGAGAGAALPGSPPIGSGGTGIAGTTGTGMAGGFGGTLAGAGGAVAPATGGVSPGGGGGAVTAGFGGLAGAAGSGGASGSAGAGGAGAGGTAGAGGGLNGGGTGGVLSSAGPLHFGPNVRINDDTGAAPQEEVTLAASKGVLVAGWMDGRKAANGRSGYMCGYSVSRDGGETWSPNSFATTQGGGSLDSNFDGDPGVAADETGNFYLSAEDYGAKRIVFASSTDQGNTFSPFASAESAIDKPWIAAARDGTVFMSWLGTPGGFTRSLDHGKTWAPVTSIGSLYSGTAIASGGNGYVHIPFATSSGTLRYLRSKDWGQTLETARDLDTMGTQDCTNCEPRDLPVVGCATDPSGQTVAITWAGKISGGDGNDDVWVLISKDGGDTWSKRLRVNDNQQASRQFQPWVAVDASGRVHVAWTDLRNAGMNSVYYASALDPSQGFGQNVEVTDKRGAANTFLGDYKGLVLADPYIVVAWTDTRNGNPDIYTARAKLDGSLP